MSRRRPPRQEVAARRGEKIKRQVVSSSSNIFAWHEREKVPKRKKRKTHGNAEMLRRDREGLGQILGCPRLRLGQGVVVEQVGSVTMNKSATTGGGGVRERAKKRNTEAEAERKGDAQCEPVLPAPGKVFDVDFVVRRGLALTPQQQPFFGVRAFFAVVGAGRDRSETVRAFRRN